MRINEAYEHEPLRQPEGDAAGSCPGSCNNCNKVGAQSVDIAAPLVLTPSASVGTVTVSCQGVPTVECIAESNGSRCVVTMTQQLCVSVPVRYGVTLTPGEPTIACAGDCTCRCDR